ncbi:MAG: sulfotransferase [Halioglobus sp.]|nr:sulfotransferase [Halioglobus sp.]
MPTEKRPNLFIVGAQKAGTSALAGWLSQHPQVYISFPKEPGFLAFGTDGYNFSDGYGNAAPASRYVVRDHDSYLALFAGAHAGHRIIGEASTWYLSIPGMAQKLKDYNPRARVILVLRNPVERAYSAWCHARGDRLEPCESFAEALALEEQRGEVEFLLRYRRMGLYAQALEEYLDAFGTGHVLVMFHDDMRGNPVVFWEQVCNFLQIDASAEPAFKFRYNRAGEPRSRLLQRLLRSHRVKQTVRRLLPHRVSLSIKNRLDDANLRDFPPMENTVRDELRDYYRDDIRRLAALTDRDLEAWLR